MIINNNAKYSINDIIPIIEECIENGTDIRIKVSGISMTPILHNLKDSVVLSKADKVKKYDIILYKRDNGQYILHRVIKKKGSVLTLAGDFETEKEFPVYESAVIAKVTSFCRNGKDYTAEDFIIKLYSRIWVFILPARQHVLCALKYIRRFLNV